MHRRVHAPAAVAVLLLIGSARLANGYSGGPPDGFAGDPPLLRNCTACHSSYLLNSGNGALTVTGLPLQYLPGETYLLHVHLVDSGQKRWGFELTAIQPSTGNEAGTLIVADDVTTQISYGTGEERDYVKHRLAGTFPNTNFGDWPVYWVAPQAGAGAARFYIAGNAANNSATQAGDFIYTLSVEMAEGVPVAVGTEPARPLLLLTASPNPMREQASVAFALHRAGPVELRVLDAQGRFVRGLFSGALEPGRHLVRWDGLDAQGNAAPSGIYFYLLNADAERTNLRAVKVR